MSMTEFYFKPDNKAQRRNFGLLRIQTVLFPSKEWNAVRGSRQHIKYAPCNI